jgi:hypothetical protein
MKYRVKMDGTIAVDGLLQIPPFMHELVRPLVEYNLGRIALAASFLNPQNLDYWETYDKESLIQQAESLLTSTQDLLRILKEE